MPKKTDGTPKVEVRPLTDAVPDDKNVNRHTQRAGGLLENSLRKRGFFRPIAAAGKGVERPVIKAGSHTQEKAIEAGMGDEAIFIYTDGSRPIVHVRTDLDPDGPEAAMLGIEDNHVAYESYDVDPLMLAALAEGDNAVLADLIQSDAMAADILAEMADAAEEKENSSGGSGGGGYDGDAKVIQYIMIFDDEEQQEAFYDFIRFLKDKYPTDETIAARLTKFIDENGFSRAKS